MEFALFWIGFAVAIGVWASNRGRSGAGWFFLAVLISPLLAAIFLAVSKDLATANGGAIGPRGHCPECGEDVAATARLCKHCGSAIDGLVVRREPPRSTASAIKNSAAYKTIFYGIFGLFILVAIVGALIK